MNRQYPAPKEQQKEKWNRQDEKPTDFQGSNSGRLVDKDKHVNPFVYPMKYAKAGDQIYMAGKFEFAASFGIQKYCKPQNKECKSIDEKYKYHTYIILLDVSVLLNKDIEFT